MSGAVIGGHRPVRSPPVSALSFASALFSPFEDDGAGVSGSGAGLVMGGGGGPIGMLGPRESSANSNSAHTPGGSTRMRTSELEEEFARSFQPHAPMASATGGGVGVAGSASGAAGGALQSNGHGGRLMLSSRGLLSPSLDTSTPAIGVGSDSSPSSYFRNTDVEYPQYG